MFNGEGVLPVIAGVTYYTLVFDILVVFIRNMYVVLPMWYNVNASKHPQNAGYCNVELISFVLFFFFSSILTLILNLEEFLKNYCIPIAFIDGDRWGTIIIIVNQVAFFSHLHSRLLDRLFMCNLALQEVCIIIKRQ